MRLAVLLLLSCACYTKSDARRQLKDLGRPEPIECVVLNSAHSDGGQNSYVCHDGGGTKWFCDSDGCINYTQ